MGVMERHAAGTVCWAELAAPDVAGARAGARRLGAECSLPPTPIPGVGTVALLKDPQGGAFALMQASGGSAEGD